MKKLIAILSGALAVVLFASIAFAGTFTDTFDNSSLDTANFGTSTNNLGTVTEGTALLINAPAPGAPNAAITFYKGVTLKRTNTWSMTMKFRCVASNPPASSIRSYLWTLPSGLPAHVASAAVAPKNAASMFYTYRSGSGEYHLYLNYRVDASNTKFWNNGGGTWDASFVEGTTSFNAPLDTDYIFIMESDGTNLTMEIQDASTSTLWGPASIAWSGVYGDTLDFFMFGDVINDSVTGAMVVKSFSYTGPEIGAVTGDIDPTLTGTPLHRWNSGTPFHRGEGTPLF